MSNWKRKTKLSELFLAVLFLSAVAVFLHYSGFLPLMGKVEWKNPVGVPHESSSIDETEAKVNKILNGMSLEEKVGQLLMIGFGSTAIDDNIVTMLSRRKVGGVILFDRNMESPAQVADLNNHLQEIALKNRFHVPLLIGVDQEGGIVTRMREKVTVCPSQKDIAKAGDDKHAYNFAKITGTELLSMGFNVNFAPVLDLSEKDSRSYSNDPIKCTQFGRAAVSGYQETGVVSTIKHFPGIGLSKVDPHHENSVISASKDEMSRNDLYPFKKLIQESDNQRLFVMVSHLKFTAYDSANPASLSSAVMQRLLREDMGFKGLVVTDDLEMGALANSYSFRDMGYLAVKAGADLLLVCHEPEHQKEVYEGIIDAVKEGKLSEERLNDSVMRVLLTKFTLIRNTRVDPSKASEDVGSKAHAEAIEIFNRSRKKDNPIRSAAS